jgi:hypothetical protein
MKHSSIQALLQDFDVSMFQCFNVSMLETLLNQILLMQAMRCVNLTRFCHTSVDFKEEQHGIKLLKTRSLAHQIRGIACRAAGIAPFATPQSAARGSCTTCLTLVYNRSRHIYPPPLLQEKAQYTPYYTLPISVHQRGELCLRSPTSE